MFDKMREDKITFAWIKLSTLWLYSDPYGTAVSQKCVLRDNVSTKDTLFFVKNWYSINLCMFLEIFLRLVL